jgi:hypothetical protein
MFFVVHNRIDIRDCSSFGHQVIEIFSNPIIFDSANHFFNNIAIDFTNQKMIIIFRNLVALRRWIGLAIAVSCEVYAHNRIDIRDCLWTAQVKSSSKKESQILS